MQLTLRMLNRNNLIRFFFNSIHDPVFYKFIIVGFSAALLILLFTGIFTSFMEIPVQLSVLISWEFAVLWAFFLLEQWVFSKSKKKHSKMNRLIRFHLITAITLGINEVVLTVLLIHTDLHYLMAEAFAILSGFLFNYPMNRKFSWGLKSFYT